MMASAGDWRRLRPWILGAIGWGCVSLIVMLDYIGRDEPQYVTELWFILSLLWWEFGFAGIFSAIRHEERHRVLGLVLVSLLPPAALYLLIPVLT
jgi:4-amino-4-deoxy-L-arabinose transferase-like glycosyltransferase